MEEEKQGNDPCMNVSEHAAPSPMVVGAAPSMASSQQPAGVPSSTAAWTCSWRSTARSVWSPFLTSSRRSSFNVHLFFIFFIFYVSIQLFVDVGFLRFDWLWCQMLKKKLIFGWKILESLNLVTFFILVLLVANCDLHHNLHLQHIYWFFFSLLI